MNAWCQFLKVNNRLNQAVMLAKSWDIFVKALALALLAYWIHLSQDLNDWLGSKGFHLTSPGRTVFEPLAFPFPQLLWGTLLVGILFMFFARTVTVGSVMGAGCFFYVTMCDSASRGALNMNFLFALAVIFWKSACLKTVDGKMSAWPAYLIRFYLVVVYFGSGWRKVIYGDWLEDPNALLHCMTGFFTTDLTRELYSTCPLFAWTLSQYLTLAFELGAPLLLLYPPARKIGVFFGCFLHLGIALLMKDLCFFSFQMITFYIPVLASIYHFPAASSKSCHQSGI